jgi:hypothetical protein
MYILYYPEMHSLTWPWHCLVTLHWYFLYSIHPLTYIKISSCVYDLKGKSFYFVLFFYISDILLILRTDVLKLKKEGIHRHCWQIWQEHTTYLYQQSVDLEVRPFTILYCHNNSRTDYLQDHFTFSVIFKFNNKNIKSFIDRWSVMKYVDERAP